MHRTTLLLAAPLLLTACGISQRAGTQIGVEEEFRCMEVSSTVLTDLDAIPEGFDSAPNALVAAQIGSFSGPQLDAQEQPTAQGASLQVAQVPGEVVLLRYAADSDDAGLSTDEMAPHCPPALVMDLSFSLQAEGLPDYSEILSTRIGPEGEAWAQVQDSSGFAEALPAPSAFNPEDFDVVYTDLVLSGGYGDWWGYVSWEAYNSAEMASDGDVPITNELLVMARMGATE